MLKRLFFAIPLSEKHLEKLKEVGENQKNLKNVRWTNFDNLHITLLFLGDVDEKYIPLMIENLKLKIINSFSLIFKDLVLAPPNRPPRMIWVEFGKNADFDRLNNILCETTKEFVRINPQKDSIPHVTMARFQSYVDLQKIDLPQLELEPLKVSIFYLVESTLTPRGPIYQKLAEFKLGE